MKRIFWLGLIAAVGAIALVVWATGRSAAVENEATIAAYLSGTETEGFARATEPGTLSFPRDFGAHEDYQTEWWYYTGNLETAAVRPFGYQFTIFRRALTPPPAEGGDGADDSWRTNQLYFAHFTISDPESGRFYDFEKFSRGAAGLAGASAAPYEVWIENWQVAEQPDGSAVITAEAGQVALSLTLRQTQPPVLQGDRGLSVKGAGEGNASYYYSLVNQRTEGEVTIDGERYPVSGHSWTDHEFSTSALEAGAVGWDWFSLQFDNADQKSLMLFEIRQEDGSIGAASGGSWVLPDSSIVALNYDEIQIEVLDTWTSPESGAEYPAGWRIQIPKIGLDITGYPLMNDQELNLSTIYWEGAVRFEGTLQGEPVNATGYIELTGYGQSMQGRI